MLRKTHFTRPPTLAEILRQTELAENIRRPPRPPGWKAERGWCTFCAGKILEWNGYRWIWRHRKGWHLECLRAWFVCSNPIFARAMVFRRDRGICADCGENTIQAWSEDWLHEILAEIDLIHERPQDGFALPNLGPWELDHEYPLWLVDRQQADALKYWSINNLATRCCICHKAKTAREAQNRAKVKRHQIRRGARKARTKVSEIPW